MGKKRREPSLQKPNRFSEKPVMSDYTKKQIEYWEKEIDKAKSGAGGRPQKIKSPEELWQYACEYFKECLETPMVRVMFKGKDVTRVEVPVTVPFTIGGFQEFLRSKGVVNDLKEYTSNRRGSYGEFATVINHIKQVCRTQKLNGALAGHYPANLISTVLGLVQKIEKTTVVEQPLFGGDNIVGHTDSK